MTSVLIRGDGVAARCCAHLLVRSGFSVSVERTTRPRLPAIMLGIPAQQLIRDIFGRDELFRDLPPIRIGGRSRLGMQRRDSRLQLIRTGTPQAQSLFNELHSFRDRRAIPERAVLLLQRHQFPIDRPSLSPRIVKQHQRQ